MGSTLPNLYHGHLGLVQYDSSKTQWLSQRKLDEDGSWSTLTSTEVHVSPTASFVDDLELNGDLRESSLMWRDLRQAYPETAASVSLLQSLARFETADQRAASFQLGDRLLDSTSVGAPHLNGRRDRLFAFATGPSGDILGLVVGRALRRGWRDDYDTWISTVDPAEANINSWNAGLGQIRQLFFQRSSAQRHEHDRPILVVRFETAVCLLQLIFDGRGSAIPGWRRSHQYPVHISRRDFPLRFWRFGTHVVDMTTCPSNPCLMAAVQSDGRLNVWHVNPQDGSCVERAVQEGRLKKSNQERSSVVKEWHRVFWLPSERLVALCTRFQMDVFHLGEPVRNLGSHHFPASSHAFQIHAAKQNPFDPAELFVVSSTSVHWFREDASGPAVEGEPHDALKEIAQWRHSLDLRGCSVQISFCNDADRIYLVLLSSNAPFILKYSLAKPKPDHPDTTTVGLSPSMLDLPLDLQKHTFLGLTSLPCLFHYRGRGDDRSVERHSPDQDTKFFQLFVLDRDLSLKSVIYYLKRPSADRPAVVEPLLWSKAFSRSINVLSEKFVREDFVADDEDLDLLEDEDALSHHFLRRFRRLNAAGPDNGDRESTRPARIVTNERLYYEIIGPGNQSSQLDTALTALASAESSPETQGSQHASLLASKLGELPVLKDIDLSEHALRDFVASLMIPTDRQSSQERLTILPLRLPSHFEALSFGPDASPLSSFYHACIETWIRPLPAEAPIAARLAKERAARYVTTAVCLSSIRLDPPLPPAQESQPTEQTAQSQPSTTPAPSSTQQPSTTQENPSQTENPPSTPTADALTRLRRYASANDPPQPSEPFTRLATRVLSTWTVGAAHAPEASIAALSSAPAASGMDAAARARQLRRLEKRKQFEARMHAGLAKRPRLHDQPGFAARVADAPGVRASSPVRAPPELWLASSPAPHSDPAREAGREDESQRSVGVGGGAGPGGFAVASQVEPGRHGGRPVVGFPIRKKPRKPGF